MSIHGQVVICVTQLTMYLLTSSPVLLMSKKLTSCCISDWKSWILIRTATRSPTEKSIDMYMNVRRPCSVVVNVLELLLHCILQGDLLELLL